ncbi:MAG: hypothetical protein AB7O26_03765 [Planctomycetaceae bacterium]
MFKVGVHYYGFAGASQREIRVMEHFVGTWFEYLLESWRGASPVQYAILIGCIILSGWLVSRFTSV